jgi:hypothetical protein
MPKRYTIKDMQSYASNYGGKCLSKEFISIESPLKWQCNKGHTWDADFQIIRQGGWCQACLKENKRKEERLEEMCRIAINHQGKCLSTEYFNSSTKMKFQCSKGHVWVAIASNIKRGYWCRLCVIDSQRDSINTFHKIAADHNGKCLSSKYLNNDSRLKFQCALGHIWSTRAAGIIKGCWCPVCGHIHSAEVQKESIETFRKIAVAKGGKCLSSEHVNSLIKLKFQCKAGHVWNALPGNIKNGTWCKKCANKIKSDKQKDSIETFYEIAKKHGGKCLSEEYVNSYAKLKFRCKEWHVFLATAHKVKSGSWCPECAIIINADKLRDSIEIFHLIASKHKGKCLSKEYVNKKSRLEFQCAKGHIWKTTAQSVKSGTWCPQCVHDNLKDSIQTYRKIAKQHKGKCLSDVYIQSHSKLKFQCANGHIWKAKPYLVKQGRWCPVCAVNNRVKKKK